MSSLSILILASIWITSTALSKESFRNVFNHHVRRSVVSDFDEHTRQWVENQGRKVQRKVLWWDLYGTHDHLQERPQYRRFKVDVRMSNIQYGDVTSQTERPQQVYTKWFCNNLQNAFSTKISRKISRSEVFSWTVERRLRIGTEVKISANIPSVLDISAGISTQVDLLRRENNIKEESETFSIDYDLTVDAQTAVKATWVITEREVEIPFTADVFIDGYVAIWYDKKLDDHWLWFYPMSWLEGGDFRKHGNGGLAYTISGVFRGIRGVDSVIATQPYPVQEGKCEPVAGAPTKNVTFQVPLRMNGPIHGDE